jgi:hypothetical protein
MHWRSGEKLYVDQYNINLASADNDESASTISGTISYNYLTNVNIGHFEGQYLLGYVWDKKLTAKEFRTMMQVDPFGPFRAQRQKMFPGGWQHTPQQHHGGGIKRTVGGS